MSDNVYAAPLSSLKPTVATAAEDAKFYVVSPRKIVIMYLGTVGLYLLYWFYKQWETLKDNSPYESDAGRCWPVMRAIFSVFFTHSLFRQVKAAGEGKPQIDAWRAGIDATLMVVFVLIPAISNRLDRMGYEYFVLDLIAFLLIVPTVLLLRRVQRKVNIVCGDEEGGANDRITAANIAWLVLGGLFWLGIAAGFYAGLTGAAP